MLLVDELLEQVVEQVVSDSFDEECLVDPNTGGPVNDVCIDEGLYARSKGRFKKLVRGTLDLVISGGGGSSSSSGSKSDDDEDEYLFGTGALTSMGGRATELDDMSEGELLEKGWEARGNSSSLRRNAEVWKFAFQCVFKVLKARKLTKAGAEASVISDAKVEAAKFIRDGLLRLGPTFVKLGQVVSTRTDVLPKEYTDVLKTLQDDVPGFSGKRAKDIISKELGKPCDSVFQKFSIEPLAAASLGQVHTATYKGKKVAIKVQRAGLKELFDVDLKNLKKLAELLDKFDPKTDGKSTIFIHSCNSSSDSMSWKVTPIYHLSITGADRDWVSIYEESERLLYLEIDYLNEAANCERFARDFSDVDWVRVPEVYRDVSTPRVLTMEFLDSIKLTDIKQLDQLGLDRDLLAKRTADAFLRQIVETGYFHCDPHPVSFVIRRDYILDQNAIPNSLLFNSYIVGQPMRRQSWKSGVL